MNTRERILSIRLGERIENDPEYATKIGLETSKKERKCPDGRRGEKK